MQVCALTLALSLGRREPEASCSLLPRERARVRANPRNVTKTASLFHDAVA
jgi:hypothetical protein